MGVSSRLDIPASSKMKTAILLLFCVAIAYASTSERRGKMGRTTTEASVERRGKMDKTTTVASEVREGSEEDEGVNEEDAAGKGKGKGKRGPKSTTEATLDRKGKMGKATTEATEDREGSEEDEDVSEEDVSGKGKGKGKRRPKTTTEASTDY